MSSIQSRTIGVLLLIASVGYTGMSAAYIGFPSYVASVDRIGMILIQGELAAVLGCSSSARDG
ncbi:MAG TPA: hypothetical protein VGQ44_06350 [Gemmatimonadaceae bacterium]|jgi:hypothetical protein|nr:hypothetical protein [Gemmatimonadaceae bacterium]